MLETLLDATSLLSPTSHPHPEFAFVYLLSSFCSVASVFLDFPYTLHPTLLILLFFLAFLALTTHYSLRFATTILHKSQPPSLSLFHPFSFPIQPSYPTLLSNLPIHTSYPHFLSNLPIHDSYPRFLSPHLQHLSSVCSVCSVSFVSSVSSQTTQTHLFSASLLTLSTLKMHTHLTPQPVSPASHEVSCIRLAFHLLPQRPRSYSIHLSIPSLNISAYTQQTSSNVIPSTLTIPHCNPNTKITFQLLHNTKLITTNTLTYAQIRRSNTHRLQTPHALITIYAVPHAPELATLQAHLRVASSGILNAPRLSPLGYCSVQLNYLSGSSWVPFYKSATSSEKASSSELLSYGHDSGADTYIQIIASRIVNGRTISSAQLDTTMAELLHPGANLSLLSRFKPVGYIKVRSATHEKSIVHVSIDAFLLAKTSHSEMALIPAPPATQLHIDATQLQNAAVSHDYRAPGVSSLVRGLFANRRTRKINQAMLMVMQSVENDSLLHGPTLKSPASS